MRKWKQWSIFLVAAILSLSFIWLVFKSICMDLLVNLWWFESLDYKDYYLMRLKYRYLTFFGTTFAFFLIFFINFWTASCYLGKSSFTSQSTNFSGIQKILRLPLLIQSGCLKIYVPLSLIFATALSLPVYKNWERLLLCVFGSNSSIKDPIFDWDIVHYLISFPSLAFIQNRLFFTFLILLCIIGLFYMLESRLLRRDGKPFPKGAKSHLNLMILILIILKIIDFFLQKINMVYTEAHLPWFFGPGSDEIWWELPIMWLMIISFACMGFTAIYYLSSKKFMKFLMVSTTVFLGTAFIQNVHLLQKSKPKNPEKEAVYIENSINATLTAFGLDKVERRVYPVTSSTQAVNAANIRQILPNVPVWDKNLLAEVYAQHQNARSYYTFTDTDEDRYLVNGIYQQVYLAAREIDVTSLPAPEQDWEKLHRQYTHGHGVVMTPAAQGGDEPMLWLMGDIPAKSDYGFQLPKPDIYFGTGKYSNYALLFNKSEVSKSSDSIKKGIHLNFIQKALFSLYFKDWRILKNAKDNSRLVFRRKIQTAVKTLTPFLTLDNDPYIVATENGLFWMQDAYTLSNKYPYAQPYSHEDKNFGNSENNNFSDIQFNYIRDAVKIVMDANNGKIFYYIVSYDDPIIQAYDKMYPGLFKPLAQMPENLKKHLRYPRQLFEIQMQIYARYHQADPAVFYHGKDQWAFAQLEAGKPLKPYYLTLNLLHPDQQEFFLISPMSAGNHLRALAIAGCDPQNYGRMVVYTLSHPQILKKISGLIKEDTDINHVIKVWEGTDAKVQFGRMIILPVNKSLLYVQPIYIRSASHPGPQLKRIIVGEGDMIVMEKSLEEGVAKLEKKLKERAARINRRLPKPRVSPKNS